MSTARKSLGVIGLAAVAILLQAGWALAITPVVWTEDFENETAYPDDSNIGDNADWYAGGSTGSHIQDGTGQGGSRGLTKHGNIFTWTAHPWKWSDLSVNDYALGKMDFETEASGTPFDDDRVGWMIKDDSTSSSNILAVQLDPGGSGNNIECYWDSVGFGDDQGRKSICDVPALTGSTFYRLIAKFTKLDNTSASIDVELWSLDTGGNLDTLKTSGSIPDTSLLSGDKQGPPMSEYFEGLAAYGNTLWPAYKNYTGSAHADNAYFGVPEPATLGLLAAGGLLTLLRRRR